MHGHRQRGEFNALSGEAEYASWVLGAPRPANPTEALARALGEALADQFAALAARLADIDAKLGEPDERPAVL
jgi:hypothetical protein